MEGEEVMTYYAPCNYCRTEKPAPSGNCFNCGAPLLEVLGTFCGRPITDREMWKEIVDRMHNRESGYWGELLSAVVLR